MRAATRLATKPIRIAESGEQKKEAGPDETELARRKRELLHDRHGGKADNRLVCEIDQHVEKQKTSDCPRAFWGRFRSHRVFPRSVSGAVASDRPEADIPPGETDRNGPRVKW